MSLYGWLNSHPYKDNKDHKYEAPVKKKAYFYVKTINNFLLLILKFNYVRYLISQIYCLSLFNNP